MEANGQTTTPEVDTQEKPKTSPKKVSRGVSTTPWKPSRVLDIPQHLKVKGFTYRWASKNQVGRIQKLISEGWEIDTELSKKLSTAIPKTIIDGSPLDGTVQRRELIVMRIPDEMADARRAYYAQKAAGAVTQNEAQLKVAGIHPQTKEDLTYGEVKSTD